MAGDREQRERNWPRARQACEELYARHARRLLAFLAARVSRSDLEDVHQAVWERVWRHLPSGFRGGNFRAWLYQIARNYLTDMRRKKKPETAGNSSLELANPAIATDELVAARERFAILLRCLGDLSDEAASLVRARLAGESYEEICRRTGWKVERAHKMFHQAKHQLQSCIQRAEA